MLGFHVNIVWLIVSLCAHFASPTICGQCQPEVVSFLDQDIRPFQVGGNLSIQCVPHSDLEILIECCQAMCQDACCGIVSTNQSLSCTQACVMRRRGVDQDQCLDACEIQECDHVMGQDTYDTCGQCECEIEDSFSCQVGCGFGIPCENVTFVVNGSEGFAWHVTNAEGQIVTDACLSPGLYALHTFGTGSVEVQDFAMGNQTFYVPPSFLYQDANNTSLSTASNRQERLVDIYIASCTDSSCSFDASSHQRLLGETLSYIAVHAYGTHVVLMDAVDDDQLAAYPIQDATATGEAHFIDDHLDKNVVNGQLSWVVSGSFLEPLELRYDVSAAKCFPLLSNQSQVDCHGWCPSALPARDADYFVVPPERNVTAGCVTAEVRTAANFGAAETLRATVDCGDLEDYPSLNFSISMPPTVWTLSQAEILALQNRRLHAKTPIERRLRRVIKRHFTDEEDDISAFDVILEDMVSVASVETDFRELTVENGTDFNSTNGTLGEWDCMTHCGLVGPCSCRLDCVTAGTCCNDFHEACYRESGTWLTHAPCRAQGACIVLPADVEDGDACVAHARKNGMLAYAQSIVGELNVTTPDRGISLWIAGGAKWNHIPLTAASEIFWAAAIGDTDRELCLVATTASTWAYTDGCEFVGSCVRRVDASCSAISFHEGLLTYTDVTFVRGDALTGPPPHIRAEDIIHIPPGSTSLACLHAETLDHDALAAQCYSACSSALTATCPRLIDCWWDHVPQGDAPCDCATLHCWDTCHTNAESPSTLRQSIPYDAQCLGGPLLAINTVALSHTLDHLIFPATMTHLVITPRTTFGPGLPIVLPLEDLRFHLTDLHFVDVDYDLGEIAGAFSWSLSFPFEFGVPVTFTIQLNDSNGAVEVLRTWTSEWDAQRHIMVPYDTTLGNFTHLELSARTVSSTQVARVAVHDREFVITDAHWVDADKHGDEVGGRLNWTQSIDHHPDFAYEVIIMDIMGNELYNDMMEEPFIEVSMDTPWKAQIVSIAPVVDNWRHGEVFSVQLVDTDNIPPAVHVGWNVLESVVSFSIEVEDGSFPANIGCRLLKNDSAQTEVWSFANVFGVDWYNVTRDKETIRVKAYPTSPFFEYTLHCSASDRFGNAGESVWGPFRPPFICGSGFLFDGVSSPERCDDGNRRVGDGCDDQCLIEEHWVCRNGSATSSSKCNAALAIVETVFSLSMDFGDNDPPSADDPVFVDTIRKGYAQTLGIAPDIVWVKVAVTVSSRRLAAQHAESSTDIAQRLGFQDADRSEQLTERRLTAVVSITVTARIDCDATVNVTALHQQIGAASTFDSTLPTVLRSFPVFAAVVITAYLIESPAPNIRDATGTCAVFGAATQHPYWGAYPTPCQHIFSNVECDSVWACTFVYAPYFVYPPHMSEAAPSMELNRTNDCPATTFPSRAPQFSTHDTTCFCPYGQAWDRENRTCVGEYCRCSGVGCQHAHWCDDDLPQAWNFTEFTTNDVLLGTGCFATSTLTNWISCGHACQNACLRVATRDECLAKWACSWVGS